MVAYAAFRSATNCEPKRLRGSHACRSASVPQGCGQAWRWLFQWKPSWETTEVISTGYLSGKVIQAGSGTVHDVEKLSGVQNDI